MATIGGTLSSAWKATSWSARNLTPIGKNGRLVWALGSATALALTMAAPPVAFASAAQGITASSGAMDYAGAGLSLAWEGAQQAVGVGWEVKDIVAEELPGIYDRVLASGAS